MAKRHRVPPTTARTVFLLPTVPDDAPEDLKNAIAVRNAATRTGTCPGCGAEGQRHSDRHEPWLAHLVFEHEPDCIVFTGDAA
jgi:hypothetical protein